MKNKVKEIWKATSSDPPTISKTGFWGMIY
jgi:hypothetical protein